MEYYGELERTLAKFQRELKERIAYIALRKKCVAELKRLGIIPAEYTEHYTVCGTEIS